MVSQYHGYMMGPFLSHPTMPDSIEAFTPSTIADLTLADKGQLISYLKANAVPFGEGALKPELLAKAREFFSSQSAAPSAAPSSPSAPAPTKQEPRLLDADLMTDNKALSALQTKGFKDKDEIIHYLNSLERKTVELAAREADVNAKLELIEQKEISFDARELAIKKDVEKFVALNNENDKQLQELNRLQGKIPQ